MTVKHDPWRQRPRRRETRSRPEPTQGPAQPVQPVVSPPELPAPPAVPAPAEQAPAPEHAPPPTDEERGALRQELAKLDRDEVVELAGESGLDTYRVRTATLLDQLAAAGVRPPTAGVTRKVGS